MRSNVLPNVVAVCLVAFGAVANSQLVTIWGASLEDQGTTEILSASAIYSPVDVVGSITNYQVVEVDSLLIIEGISSTQTVISTPTTVTYTIQRGASLLGNTIFETDVPSPGTTVVAEGVAVCEPSSGVTLSPGVEVQCLEIVTESVVNGVQVVTTIGYNGILHALATITAPSALSTINIESSTSLPSTQPLSPSPTPSPTVPTAPAAPITQITVGPSSTNGAIKKMRSSGSFAIMVILYSVTVLIL